MDNCFVSTPEKYRGYLNRQRRDPEKGRQIIPAGRKIKRLDARWIRRQVARIQRMASEIAPIRLQ